MAQQASHGGYLVSDISSNPLQFYPVEMPGGKDNYLDDNGINAIRHLTLVFPGHMHRVCSLLNLGLGSSSSPPPNPRVICICSASPDEDPFLGQM